MGDLIEKLRVLETGLRDLDRMAARQVKAVMGEFDKRLARALGEKAVQADHVVHPNHPAPHPTPKPPTPKRVAARADHPLGKPPGLETPDPLPAKTPPDKNLHPQGVEEEPSAPKPSNDSKIALSSTSYDGTLYRLDSRPPEDRFNGGFQPWGTSDDLKSYVDTNAQSTFVGTSTSPDIVNNPDFNDPGKYLYQVDGSQVKGVNVNSAYPDGPFPHEQEFATMGGIPSQSIISAQKILPNGSLGNPIINPNYGSR